MPRRNDGFCPRCGYETCSRCNVCQMCGHGVECGTVVVAKPSKRKTKRIELLERRERTREAWELMFGRSDSESKILDSIRDCLGPDGRETE